MRRLILVLSIAALMAAMLVASALPAFAQATSEDASCVGQELSETATGSTGFPPGSVGTAVSTSAQTLDPGDVGFAFSVTAQLPREAC